MFDHIMLDLETLDTRETAVILSIGAVGFNLDDNLQTRHEFYHTIDPKDCQQWGRTIDADTVVWWMKQSTEAQRVITDTHLALSSLPHVLLRFTDFVNSSAFSMAVGGVKVWGNGSNFDNAILKNAYRACNLPVPWSYKNDMCFRTMMKMFPVKEEPSGVKHHALDDARRQAQALIRVWQSIERHNPMDLPAVQR